MTRLLPLLLTTACLVPGTRDQYVTDLAFDVCTEKASCDEIGENGQYASFADCTADIEATARDAWPADECTAETIDRDAYDDCHDEAVIDACGSAWWEQLDTVAACRAAEVCSG